MTKMRFALTCSLLALPGTIGLGALSSAAEAQTVSGGYYYGPPPVYAAPPPAYAYPPTYYYPAPAYYYPPPPAYYYPPPPPVYYQQPSYWTPGISANFIFGFGGGHRRWHHH